MWVKICGITNLDDALCAIDAGADALGFVFYTKSARYIIPEKAKTIVHDLPLHVKKIGLFVGTSPEEINLTCKATGMDIAQIHFDVDEAFLEQLELPYLRVVRAQKAEDVLQYQGSLRLVDAYVESFGGSGQRVEPSWFKHADTHNIILAGGLSPSNVEELKGYGFYGVDVSSGVEKSKGIKDHMLVRAFIQKAKA